jgi:hypothetical protein
MAGKKKSVGTGANIGNTGFSGVPDKFGQVLAQQHGFPAGKGDGLESLFPCRINDLFELIIAEPGSVKFTGFAHAALGAGGVAPIRNLDNKLAGHPAFEHQCSGFQS